MKWPAKNPGEWQRKFAWFPVRIDAYWVWWEVYEERLGGYGFEVRLV